MRCSGEENMIESEKKAANGEPVWRLSKENGLETNS